MRKRMPNIMKKFIVLKYVILIDRIKKSLSFLWEQGFPHAEVMY